MVREKLRLKRLRRPDSPKRLMVAGPKVSFRYSDAYTASAYGQLWTYPEYRTAARLGRALAGRKLVRGNLWQRRFACGVVRVNLHTHAASFSTKRC